MDLGEQVESVHRQFAAAAEAGGDEVASVAERLFAPLEASIRLVLQDALARAAEEITCELAPGSVELRLRGRELEFVVVAPPTGREPEEGATDLDLRRSKEASEDDGGTARINLRLPDHLKDRVDDAAGREGLSVNTWLVRTVASALERGGAHVRDRRPPQGSQRVTGWSR